MTKRAALFRLPVFATFVTVVTLILAACAVPLAPHTFAPRPIIKIGTKDFPEQFILGEGLLTVLRAAPPTGDDNDVAKVFDAVSKGYSYADDALCWSRSYACASASGPPTLPGKTM